MLFNGNFKRFRLLVVAPLAGLICLWPSGSRRSTEANADVISNYRSWTRVNDEPFSADDRLLIQCSLATPQQLKEVSESPHGHKYVIVYVNDIGKHAMLKERSPHFPEGSVIVKEKMTTAESPTPELLTVMVKREKGYNPDNGDWEFMVVDGGGKNIQARGRLENCEVCHQAEKKTDFVTRRYLTYAQWQETR
ncbi:MAG TPA: cytochrome P460 family protein [Blastocatellia bacterium]|nr:cytochrome P460 family protein [Blastocatellia bacterium]